jgi:membrane protease YdiL (CAAX protease family)
MRRFVNKEGVRGSLGAVRRWRWYAVALLVPAALVTAVLVLVAATGRGDFTAPHNWLPVTYLGLALHAVTVGSLLAFGEEYGWRGYLLPKLLPLGEIKAALIVGLIWGSWHVPILVAGLNYPSVNPWAAIAVFIPAGIIISLLVTRLYVAAGASVLVTMVFHAGLNAYGDSLTDSEHLSGNPLVVSAGGAIGMGVTALAALLAFRVHHRFLGSARQRAAAAPSTDAATVPAHQAATAYGR